MNDSEFVLLMSVGRSGSTFFGENLARFGNYHYFGEKRFLWSCLKHMPALGKYLLNRNLSKNANHRVILDKTTFMHHYLDEVILHVNVKAIILLVRSEKSIDESAERFEKHGSDISRLYLRMTKYWDEYGFFMIPALLSRFHHFANVFGIATGKFGKGRKRKSTEEELSLMVEAAEKQSKVLGIPLVKVRYERFMQDCESLEELGLEQDSIKNPKSSFKPSVIAAA